MSEDKRSDDILAAEYALNLLDGEELLSARARAARDVEFADSIAWWQGHFAPLADEIGGAEPPTDLWQRINNQLDQPGENGAEIIQLRQRVRRLQWLAAISSAAAVVALAIVALPSPSSVPGSAPDSTLSGPQPSLAAAAPLVANVPIEGTPLRLDLTYLPVRESLIVTAVGLTADGVHDHEIWLVPEEGDLISLGLVTPGEVRAHDVPHDIALQIADGSQLLLTREPLGGKPAGQDAGPVVASGKLNQI